MNGRYRNAGAEKRRGQGLLPTVTAELRMNCIVELRRTLASLHLALRIERRSEQPRHDREDDGLKDCLRAEFPTSVLERSWPRVGGCSASAFRMASWGLCSRVSSPSGRRILNG